MMEYVTIEEIDKAYRDCRRRKTGSFGCMEYSVDYIANNYALYKELNDMSYEIGPSRVFCVTRPKLREVFCAQFWDRIVHHILANKFLGIFESLMPTNAYACRRGKGVDFGVRHLSEQIDRVSCGYTREAWVLKCDISGFFMSIDRGLLYRMVEDIVRKRYHGDGTEYWLWLWKMVIMNDPTRNSIKVGNVSLFDKLPRNKSLFTCGIGKGLPIGNLPSQILANILMSDFDKWVMDRLGDGCGYGRYVDDFVCVSNSKLQLLGLLSDVRVFLHTHMGLELHPRKVYLQEARKGLKMTGAVIKPHRIYVCNHTVANLFVLIGKWNDIKNPTVGQTRKFVMRFNSLFGHLGHRNSYAIRWRAWKRMSHKDRIFCENMRKICIINKNKSL